MRLCAAKANDTNARNKEEKMDFIEEILKPVAVPKVIRIRQMLEETEIADVENEIVNRLKNCEGFASIGRGQRIAITAGSRAIHGIDIILSTVAAEIRKRGASPFIVPAMGSHGGATANGQTELLSSLGITETSVGAPICSSMEVDLIGHIADGRPVYMDRYANNADGIVVVNRIKPHTSFRGPFESGLMKMMAIGLGKQTGAQMYHSAGFGMMAASVEAVGREVLRLKNIVCGVGIVENGHGKTAMIEVLNAGDIAKREKELLTIAAEYMPRLFFKDADVLIVKNIGKDISGTGMDSNVTGRFNSEHVHGDVHIGRIAILNLTDKSKGNANGVGLGDFITEKLFSKIELNQTYPNSLTSTSPATVKIPMILKNDEMAIKAAVKTCNVEEPEAVRLAVIESTKNMTDYYVTENLLAEAGHRVERVGKAENIAFDDDGNMLLGFD